MKKKRTHNIQRIKAGDSYFVQEICDMLKVHKNTVREWRRRGLPLIDDRRPYMILGSALKEFLRHRQSSRQHTCKPEQFYCFRCKQPRRARKNVIDATIKTAKIINLGGICEQCGCPVNKRASIKKLADIAVIFTIRAVYAHDGHLIDATAFSQLIGTLDSDPVQGKQ